VPRACRASAGTGYCPGPAGLAGHPAAQWSWPSRPSCMTLPSPARSSRARCVLPARLCARIPWRLAGRWKAALRKALTNGW